MKFEDFLIRNFEKEDADHIFKLYKEEYESYFDFSTSKDLCEYSLKETTLSMVVEYKNEPIGAYFVGYSPKQKLGYAHGLIIRKKYRGSDIYKHFMINPKNFKNLLSQIFSKFNDVDMFISTARGYSRSANTSFDLMGGDYVGLVPCMHKTTSTKVSTTTKVMREPGILRALYPQTKELYHEFYNKDLFEGWTSPEIIPEIKLITRTVLQLLNIKKKENPKIRNINISPEPILKDFERLDVENNLVSLKSEENEVVITINREDSSANIDLKVDQASVLYTLMSKALVILKEIEIITVDVGSIEEQKVFHNLGFSAIGYTPLLRLIDNRRYDVFKFIKLSSLKDLLIQKKNLFLIQKGYKLRKIADVVFNSLAIPYKMSFLANL